MLDPQNTHTRFITTHLLDGAGSIYFRRFYQKPKEQCKTIVSSYIVSAGMEFFCR